MVALTRTQLEHFEEEGYVVFENLLDPEEVLDPVIEEYAGVLDQLAEEQKLPVLANPQKRQSIPGPPSDASANLADRKNKQGSLPPGQGSLDRGVAQIRAFTLGSTDPVSTSWQPRGLRCRRG